ncbi:tyrosine-type recombinase/integrase [Acetobacter tropicalis]|uniref:Phage integrase family protein n=3 Tax=Acetobacteraceae TaxID=433 RepID=A0A095B345_9PROT|nr:tyrosine-type recombinase/integrase [Acetobacter tropicalis]KAA8384691.1 tyrosine-type recombinase/integrase [Acetobacter tropicalis]KAA8391091.1 tyrosine-type recombinase/integrase [Acetobacter tropicalis]KGB23363.1 Phage integrase family protein [Acetobacter tropicalis]MBC9009457.1 tyrosine-type recombinase/integrase [Acetobacter tropicalis]
MEKKTRFPSPTLKASVPWNAGKMVGAKRALKEKHVWAIRFWLGSEQRVRDRALFDLALDSKLRGCDLVSLRIGDIVTSGQVRHRAMVVQQKTRRPVQFEITETTRESVRAWLEHRGGGLNEYVFPSRLSAKAHLSTRQYARLLDQWVQAVGLIAGEYGTHSLRRTKVAMIYKRTGNIRAVQILLGHSKLDSTVRYLGVDVEDALALSEATDWTCNGFVPVD